MQFGLRRARDRDAADAQHLVTREQPGSLRIAARAHCRQHGALAAPLGPEIRIGWHGPARRGAARADLGMEVVQLVEHVLEHAAPRLVRRRGVDALGVTLAHTAPAMARLVEVQIGRVCGGRQHGQRGGEQLKAARQAVHHHGVHCLQVACSSCCL
jgi:hypothetical protein